VVAAGVVGADADVAGGPAVFLHFSHEKRRVLAAAEFVALENALDARRVARHVGDDRDERLIAGRTRSFRTGLDRNRTIVHLGGAPEHPSSSALHVLHEFGRLTPNFGDDPRLVGNDVRGAAALNDARVDPRRTVIVPGMP